VSLPAAVLPQDQSFTRSIDDEHRSACQRQFSCCYQSSRSAPITTISTTCTGLVTRQRSFTCAPVVDQRLGRQIFH
jgi:hypothetical protein